MAEIDKGGAEHEGLTSEYNGRTFYFCSQECKNRFERDPGAFMVDWESTDDESTPDTFSI